MQKVVALLKLNKMRSIDKKWGYFLISDRYLIKERKMKGLIGEWPRKFWDILIFSVSGKHGKISLQNLIKSPKHIFFVDNLKNA
jgi:hypothetical protein